MLTVLLYYAYHIQKKRGASLSLVPQCKGLRIARIVETSNAESPTPMYKYTNTTPITTPSVITGCAYIIHPKGRSRCFVLDNPYEFAKFLHCQNQSVQLRLSMYMCLPASAQQGFQQKFRHRKIKVFLTKN